MMLALIKKDLRVFLVPTMGGVVLISCANLICIALYLYQTHMYYYNLADSLGPAASMGTVMVALIASAYGGSSFAVERREHSADWLNMLPVTRGQIITSKVIAAFACVVALWVYNYLPLAAVYARDLLIRYDLLIRQIPVGQLWANLFAIILILLALLMGACWILFGLAWLFSTFLESAAISACLAIVIVFMAALTTEGIHHALGWSNGTFAIVAIILLAIASTASFILGTCYYLNRVEP